jgi:PKD repeat protein
MCRTEKVFLLTSLFFVLNIISVFADESLVPQIINPNTDTLRYCSDSILVVPDITIQNIEIDEANEGMKISIANYKRGEDVLVYDEVPGFDYHWVDYYGYLEIKGIATAEEYQSAVRKVYYKNIANVPNLVTRSFSISLLDADYLPQTKHFYRYVKKMDITWKEAKAAADTMTYYGLQGYLVTITSAVENNFIWTKIDGIGWIGASDEESEGVWKWVTGPEAGTHFWQGEENGYRVNNEYSNWASGSEPNNSGEEHYAHINQHPNKPAKSWNDLKNAGDGPSSDHYRAQGFIVEFGGMAGEADIKLSATAEIKVGKIAFSDEREFEICKGESQELNFEAPEIYSYSWSPDEDINGLNTSNPTVFPDNTTTYKVIGELDFCVDSVDFIVNINPLPEHTWDSVNIICEGNSIELDPGEQTSYLWENLETNPTRIVSDEDFYSVKLTNQFGCVNTDSTQVKWSVLPILDYGELDTLVCGSKQQKINLTFENVEASTNLIALNTMANIVEPTSLTPTITVDEFGIYSFRMELTDQYQCKFLDTINVEFHNQPTALFQIDEAECEGYNLKLLYKGEKEEDAIFNWYSNDTLFSSGINIDSMEIPLGYGTFNRSVGLIINEQGCIDSLKLPVTVTPILNFWPEIPEGCSPLQTAFDYSATEQVDSFYWEFGDGSFSIENKPTHIYQNSEVIDLNFDVQLKVVSAEGCENSGILNDTITVHPIPVNDLDFEENICYSEMETVWYIGSGNANDTFYWDLTGFEPGEIIQDPNNSLGPLEFKRSSDPNVEIGIKVVSEFGCETDFFSRTFTRKPIFNIELDKTEGCLPLNIDFTATTLDLVDAVDYSWNFGNGNTGNGDLVSNEFLLDDKKYSIEIVAKSDLTACSDTLVLVEEVFVYPQPKAFFDANPPSVTISNPEILFENKSINATFYEWDFGDNSAFSDEENPAHYYTEMGFFDVKLSALNDFACIDTVSHQVSVAFNKLFPPTAFSPNATLEEDREFRIHSVGIVNEGYQLLIFNRWGEVIFESINQEIGWSGKMKNDNFAPAGVYTWVLQYLDFRGEKYKQQGTVTLLF